jgi:glycosyltransferase involved in cell wall biosynthesis
MRILFDHQKFTTQKYGGISRYFFNIINHINNSKEDSCKVGVLYSQNHYLNRNSSALNRYASQLLKKNYLADKLYQINASYCRNLIGKEDYDVFHPTYYDPYFLDILKKPLVTTIHDMTYERLPEYFWAQDPLTFHKRLHIEKADAIIAISETTKEDLIHFHQVDERKVSVIYHGIEPDIPLVLEPVPNLNPHYLLYVGDRSGYKNFYLFIDAFKKISIKYPEINVVLTGGGPIGKADQELLYRLKLTDRVKHYNVSDEQLNYLYSHAILFVYPSLYEGFGLPILEAFKARCPVLLSNTTCFKEIGADAVAYFEARDLSDLAEKIESFITDRSKREIYVQRGLLRLRDFPLDLSIHKTLELYKTLT